MFVAGTTSSPRVLDQAWQFFGALFDSRIDSIDCVAWGAILLGITCGLLGTFMVLRRQSLMGDAIGHSVLPGVCLGFLAAGARNVPLMLAGALVAGLLAAWLIATIQRTTVLKSGECMGLVFTGFYGLGIVLLKAIAQSERSGQSGLEKFLLGQIAGISLADVGAMAVVAAVCIAAVILFWRPLAASSFDAPFARSVGLPARFVGNLLTFLLTTAIVISIQAVGVVLVAAMLVTPPAAAYLLTDRLHRMVILSAVFGVITGLAGAFFSLLVPDAPTGSFMVLAAATVFALAFAFAPVHGLLPRVLRGRERRRRTAAENLLRSMQEVRARRHVVVSPTHGASSAGFGDAAHAKSREAGTDAALLPQNRLPEDRIAIDELARHRRESRVDVGRMVREAENRGWVRCEGEGVVLTEAGVREARRAVRNQRLWELFLTQEAHLVHDPIQADGESIEELLPPDVLRRLEEQLDAPARASS